MADTVLIVDDDEALRTMLYKVMRSNGLLADIASCSEEALEMTRQGHYELSAAEKRITIPSTAWTSARTTM